MPRVQITREMILNTALRLLIREGHEKVTIKSVANALGCSTQPISWTFSNMENFRSALAEYALEYANEKMLSGSDNTLEEYGRVGIAYIDMAFDEPNLIRFLRSDEKKLISGGGFGQSFDGNAQSERRDALVKEYGCTPEEADRFMLDMLIYTQGLVSMIIAGGLSIDKDTAHKMLEEMSRVCILPFANNKE